MAKEKVNRFWLQPTKSFPDGAPQREEYLSDISFERGCEKYKTEWREQYECCADECFDRNCPQHFPFD